MRDILYREEIVWVYSANSAIKKAARDFKFEHDLNNLGMKISSAPMQLPQAIKLFDSKKTDLELKRLISTVERQDRQINVLYEYIASPSSVEERLKITNDILEYLDILRLIKSKYLIVLAVRDTPGNAMDDVVVQKLFELGFTNFSKELWRMYIGVSIKALIMCNRKGEKVESPLEYSLVSDTLDLNIFSKAWRQGNQALISINGVDHAVNFRGINITVYDVDNKRLIDSIAYDAHFPNARFIRK